MGAKRLGVLFALTVLAFAVPAIAATILIEVGGDVYPEKCRPCHADYSETDNPKYVFSHGNHITYQCSSCHPTFPHGPAGTQTPVMKDCFNCHGLYHGPQGVIAKGDCEACHGGKLVDLRPASHTADWAGAPHVTPAEERLTTECSMCHAKNDCDVCHVSERVVWSPPEPMIYTAGNGCLACHGSPNLIKSGADGIKSYHVTGLEASAHNELTCPDCHIDFAYADPKPPTRVWYVNAGLSCSAAGCHDEDDITAAYEASAHGAALADGDYASATCGSCHGGHDIARLDTQAAVTDLYFASEQMCAGCHLDRWESYHDPYHGQAYKRFAEDAPPCWGCHPAHEVLPSTDPESSTHPARVGETCASCHQHADAGEEFAVFSADMIHQQEAVRADNLLHKVLAVFPGGR